MNPGDGNRKPARLIAIFATAVMCATIFGSADTVPAAGRVPPLEGPAVRLDFSPPMTEGWFETLPDGFARRDIPRLAGPGPGEAAGSSAWADAAVLEPADGHGPRTEFRVFYTSRALYLRSLNEFDPASPPRAQPRERNRYRSDEDVFEIRLRVPAGASGQSRFIRDGRENPIFDFIVNQAGAIYDARDGDSAHDAQWESGVETGRDRWVAWARVPFSALGLEGPVPELEVSLGRGLADGSMVSWGPVRGAVGYRRLALEGLDSEGNPAVVAARSGRGLRLDFTVMPARPQDRWLKGEITLEEPADPGREVEITVLPTGGGAPVETARVPATRGRGRFRVDLRGLGLDSALLRARLVAGGEEVASVTVPVSAEPLPALPDEGFRIPLAVNVPEGPGPDGDWPLYAGVPFPAGMLWEAGGWVVEDGEGRAYPTQLEASGFWARDGAVRWLRVETVADPRRALFLVYRPGRPAPAPESPVRVTREGESVFVSSAGLVYELGAGPSPVAAIRHDGRLLAGTGSGRGLYLVDQRGRLATASAEGAEILVESAGPVSSCVRIEGDYRTGDGESVARHITRVEISAGGLPARVTHTLVLTRDTNETWFREAGWELELTPGADPEALFGVSREDPAAFQRVAGSPEAYLVQESYYRFGTGENRFRLAAAGQDLLAGEEMGDWFLAQNSSAGLLLSCRDAARQHPKEFSVSGPLVNLKLFSDRAGEEMDFRTETLVERWNLRGWYSNDRWDELGERARETIESDIERVRGVTSNAAGWAKTHHLLLSPAPGPRPPGDASALSAWHSRPVFALAEPGWIYRTGAMGPLHPRDPERFPEAESLVDGTLSFFASRVPLFGEWGFFDYYAGPHLNHRGKYPQARRWSLTYTLRPDSWRVLARSGLREAYDFATLTNRSWGDNYLASWGDATRTRGLYTGAPGPDTRYGSPSLPFYWGHSTNTNRSSSTNLDQFLYDYYLTGYRRAGDQVRDFAAAIRDYLSPALIDRDWRIIMTFRTLVQCYGFTWDGDLRDLAGTLADVFEDREGAIGLTTYRPFISSTYKTGVDIRALLDAREILGNRRYDRLSRLLAEYLWRSTLGNEPVSYTNPQGIAGNFLFRETGNPHYAQALLNQMRWMSSQYDRETDGHGIVLGAHAVTPIFEGIPAMQDAVVRSGADRRPATAWIGIRDFENPVEFFFRKGDRETARFSLKSPAAGSAGGSRIEPIEPPTSFDLGFLASFQERSGYTRWIVPRDLDEMAFRVSPGAFGTHYGVAHENRPLVVHAPGYWIPWPPQDPPVRWYFRVPEDSRRVSVFLEGEARVFRPDGTPWLETGGRPGRHELPAVEPGLWSFEVHEPRLVRLYGAPPFFAAERPENWFQPPVEWTPEEEPEPFEPPDETGFVAGVSGRPGEQALFISESGSFSFEGGQVLEGEGRGTDFLPFHEGTIEFWMRPEWGFHEVPERGRHPSQRLLQITTGERPWNLTYNMNYEAGGRSLHNLHSHAFAEDENRRRTFQNWRNFTLFEKGEWVHVALVWGPRFISTARGRVETLGKRVFINGLTGSRQSTEGNTQGMRPADMPLRLVLPGLGAAVDNLRVSDIARYTENFTPSRDKPEVDGHTRAFFSFDGTLEGVSGDGRTVTGAIRP